MKAEELMVGDWVHYKMDLGKDGIYEKYIQITNIYGCDVNCELREYEIISGLRMDNLYPIPLTPEILEKNTSESNKNVFGGMNYALNADFFIENRGDRFCLSRRMAGHKYSTFWVCDIHYVHELQHALRLCGIEKEIVI